ncbi:hypothetical protein M405DRAFT_837694 [Rhizopogon salebrosus TDB-379]|nr:hypothetical protein M405DRAFT_837694 [Rhizopogon salebrosus TDB-379]
MSTKLYETLGLRTDATPKQNPFVFFDQIFGDLHHAFSRDPFGDSFSDLDDDFFRGGFKSPTSIFRTGSSSFGSPIGGNSNVNVSSHGRPGGGPSGDSKRISKNYSTSNVNGVTYTKVSRQDSEGNEHVTYSYPDGTKRRLINGIEQPKSLSGRKIFKASWS